mgnify:CR=1 FL=1
MPGEWGGERANVESTILLFDITTTTTPSDGDPLMIVVWGRSQPRKPAPVLPLGDACEVGPANTHSRATTNMAAS